ncbi:MAG: hypothetical protein V1845_02200 [bacterium]
MDKKEPNRLSLFDFRGTIGEEDDHGHARQKKAGLVSVTTAFSWRNWGDVAEDENERLTKNDTVKGRAPLDELAWADIDGKPMFCRDGPN